MVKMVDISKLPLLTGADSYEVWRLSMIAHLRLRDLWKIVSGKYPRPTEYEPGSGSTACTTRSDSSSMPTDKDRKAAKELRKKVEEWDSLNEKAIGFICLTVSHSIRRAVIKMDSAKDLWDYLGRKYHIVTGILSLEGFQMATNTRFDNCKGIRDYVFKMTAAFDKIESSLSEEEFMPDAFKIQFLLSNLGKSWESFLTSYLNSRFDEKKTTLQEVIQILIQEEMRMK